MPDAQVDVALRGLRMLGQLRQAQARLGWCTLLQANPAPSLCLTRLGLFPDHFFLTRRLQEGVSAHAIQ